LHLQCRGAVFSMASSDAVARALQMAAQRAERSDADLANRHPADKTTSVCSPLMTNGGASQEETQPGDLETTQALQEALETPKSRIRRSGTAPPDTSHEKVSAPKAKKVTIIRKRITKGKTPSVEGQKKPLTDGIDETQKAPTHEGTGVYAEASISPGQQPPAPGKPTARATCTAAKSAAAPKVAAPIPELKQQIPDTPTSERLASARKCNMQDNNLGRADTQDQLGNQPGAPSPTARGGSPAPSTPVGTPERPGMPEPASAQQGPEEVKEEDATTETQERPTGQRKRRQKTAQEKANHARFMCFTRSIKRAPDEIKKAHKAARYCHEKLQILVDDWTACSGRWKDSKLVETIRARKSTSVHGSRVWMTRSQIAAKYGSQTVADEICDNKLSDENTKETQTKEHPDSKLEAMRLFLVWDSEGVSEKADVVVEQLFEAIDADDSGSESSGDKKRRKQKTQKKRKRSSSSGSVKTISSSSESSDEGKKKDKKKKSKKDKKSGKSKKEKKETKEQKEKRLQKEKKKADKEKEREQTKAKNEALAKGKKALNSISAKVADASKKCAVVAQLSDGLRAAIEGELKDFARRLAKQRDCLQAYIDMNDVDGLDADVSAAAALELDYKDFLGRANLK